MSINTLGIGTAAVGGMTTLYGLYSYTKAVSRNHPNRPNTVKQRDFAKLTMAAGIGLVAVGLGLAFYSSERNLQLSQNLKGIEEDLKNSLEPYIKEFNRQVEAEKYLGLTVQS